MRLITKIDELITDVSVEIVDTEKKLLSKRFKDTEELTEKLHEKKERYHKRIYANYYNKVYEKVI